MDFPRLQGTYWLREKKVRLYKLLLFVFGFKQMPRVWS